MKGMKTIAVGTGQVALALVGGMLFPIMIWVGLGVALHQKAHEGGTERRTTTTIREALEGAR